MPFTLRAHDKQRSPVLLAGAGANCDLLQRHGTGWLLRAYASAGRVYTGVSLNAGAAWTDTLVAEDGATAGDGCAPTLAQDRRAIPLLWYHNAAGNSVGLRSADGGFSWGAPFVEYTGRTYPRLVVQEHRQLLVAWKTADAQLQVGESADYGESTTSILAISRPEQLAAARVDRRNIAHLIFKTDADALQHAYSVGDTDFSTPEALGLTGEFPAYAQGIPEALLLYFSGSTLHTRRLEEDYATVEATLTNPGSYRPGYLGALIAHSAGAAGLLYTLGKVGGALRTYWSSAGAVWALPV